MWLQGFDVELKILNGNDESLKVTYYSPKFIIIFPG